MFVSKKVLQAAQIAAPKRDPRKALVGVNVVPDPEVPGRFTLQATDGKVLTQTVIGCPSESDIDKDESKESFIIGDSDVTRMIRAIDNKQGIDPVLTNRDQDITFNNALIGVSFVTKAVGVPYPNISQVVPSDNTTKDYTVLGIASDKLRQIADYADKFAAKGRSATVSFRVGPNEFGCVRKPVPFSVEICDDGSGLCRVESATGVVMPVVVAVNQD